MDVQDAIVVANVITPDECRDILEKEWDWLKGSWFDYHADVNNCERGKVENEVRYSANYTQAFGNEEYGFWLQGFLKEKLISALQVYNESVKDFGMSIDCITPIRINRYQEGNNIDEHIDHIHSIFDGTYKGIPVISFVGVLNDDYEGGDFMLRGKKVPLKQGDVVMFPSCFLYPHEVTTVTKGTRYSIVAWGF